MREYIAAIILGIVQGITEFLPISSDGHLVIAEDLLNRAGGGIETEGSLLTIVALHIGTLMSIVVVYRDDLLRLPRQPRTCMAIILATIPVVIIGLALKDWIESSLQTPLAAGIGLLITAAFLFTATLLERKDDAATESVSMLTALVIGIFQAIAILPGVSRSATTISTGLISGLKRDKATSFSFLIAVPAVFGAIVLTIKDAIVRKETVASYGALAVGIVVSFLVGWAALRALIRIVSNNKLHYFAWYCAILGSVVVAWQLFA